MGEIFTHTFEPIFDKNSEILVLGSFPSVKSRENNFYYAHPQNRFWRVVASVYSCPVPKTVEEKKNMLLSNKIAVWDVIKSCEITGSADSTIKSVIPNDLSEILSVADIKKIYANGKTAQSFTEMFLQFWNAFADWTPEETNFTPPEQDGIEEVPDGYVLSYCDSPISPEAVSNNLYIDLLSLAVGTDNHRLPRLYLGHIVRLPCAQRLQLPHHMRVVDDAAQHDAAALLPGGLLRQLHRPLHAVAEPGGFGQYHRHGTPPNS